MVLLSIKNQVLIYTTLLSSISFFCVYRPSTILKQGTILLLSDALDLRHYPYNAQSLVPTGFAIAILALVYFTIYVRNDMAFLSAIAPLRFIMSSAICGWSYLSDSAPIGNSLVFSFAFADMVFQVREQEH